MNSKNLHEPFSSKVEMRGGRPCLIVNGEALAPVLYGLSDIPASRSWTEQAQRNIRNFTEQGVKIIQADICLCHCWKPGNQLDMAIALKELQGVVDASPNAIIFIRLHVNPPNWWMKENPDEMVVFAEGPAEDEGEVERIISRDFDRVMRVSLASEKWLADAGAITAQFCRLLANSPHGGRVAAIQPACGAYGEWHYWGGGHEPDFSKPMLARFRKALRAKYGSDEKLREAWGDPSESLALAELASVEQRDEGADGPFRDPIAGRRAIDSVKCLQNSVADAIIHFGKTIKESWPRPIITGTFYGYYFWCGPSLCGHFEAERILASPWIDYLSGPHSYHERNRELGGTGHARGLLESARLHGKLWLTEMDERPEGLTEDQPGGDPARHPESIAKMRRNVLDPLLGGMGFWYYDHRVVPNGSLYHKNGWWDHPTLLEEVRKEKALYDVFSKRPFAPAADVALIYDTESYYHIVLKEGPNRICKAAVDNLLADVGHSGAAYDCVYLFDIERVDWSRYKCVVFANAWHLPAKQREFIKNSIAKDGRHLVWLYAPGYSDDEKLDVKLLEETTGVKAKRCDAFLETVVSGGGLPEARGRLQEEQRPLFAPDDPEAEALGHFANSKIVSAARKRLNGSVAWHFSIPPESPAFWRELFRQAGAHVYNEANDAFNAGGGLLSLHTREGGSKKILLRSGKRVEFATPPGSTTVLDAESGEVLLGAP